jgi:pimeloyl-ACP methyl ester carboxylesterase
MSEAVLFVPGAFCDERLFAHQIRDLADVSSPRYVDPPDVERIDAMAAGILAVAPERFALVGLSMGGIVAFEILRTAPQRVTRLALLATTHDLDPPPIRAIREASIAKVLGGGLAEQVQTVLPLLVGRTALGDPDVVATVRQMAMGVGAERYARQVRAIAERPDPSAVLPTIACPTLVLCGRDDVVTTPERHAALAQAIPGARVDVVDGAGHLLPLERPEPVTRALRAWLCTPL